MKSFSEKWSNNPKLAFKDTLDENSEIHQWILNRNGFTDMEDASRQLGRYSRILDAGCGNGRVTALLSTLIPRADILGVDIIDLAVAKKNTSEFKRIHYRQADLREDLGFLGEFDFIYCQEVLHHLPNPPKAFANLVDILKQGGKIAIYVYKKKAPAREFMDAYISSKISGLDYTRALKACKQIANLGKKLSELDVEIEVGDIPLMGIKKGTYPLQRFLYHHFMKCFWNEKLSLNDNAAINFDWYHPKISSHHTQEEVREWFKFKKLSITRSHEDDYGITIHGEKH